MVAPIITSAEVGLRVACTWPSEADEQKADMLIGMATGTFQACAVVEDALVDYASGERLLCMLTHTVGKVVTRDNYKEFIVLSYIGDWRDRCVAAYCDKDDDLAARVEQCCEEGHVDCAASSIDFAGAAHASPMLLAPSLLKPTHLPMLLEDDMMVFVVEFFMGHKKVNKPCKHCGKEDAPKKCGRCLTTRYCNAACQLADCKPNHKARCIEMRKKSMADVVTEVDAPHGEVKED
jgi:hypothetical protein